MAENPLVSVVAASYNEEENIERFLKSISRQTYPNIETIIVDDGSKDKTVEIARKFTKKVYPRPHAERSIQRNFGVEKAKGKYVLILDVDMELSSKVVESCLENINGHKALIIPEKTVGDSFLSKIRAFEREMYMGDRDIEVARFIEKKVFEEFGGYDPKLTGAEDYDLPHRISQKYSIGWAKEYIYHHEGQRTLLTQFKKKFYYASRSTFYAEKHPELIKRQGILIFRKAYLRNWKNFFKKPWISIPFLLVRLLETFAALAGYVYGAGLTRSVKTFFVLFKD